MDYKFRIVLYYVNRIAIAGSVAGLFYSIIMILIGDEQRSAWISRGMYFLTITVCLTVIYIIRKTKLPAAGRDYK